MMALLDITGVLFVSCFLLTSHVISHPACSTGWFGSNCKYKCRCTQDGCDGDGLCTGTATCQGGWFGPACQYADLAYGTSGIQEAVDGDDDTCINSTSQDSLVISLNDSVYFTWLRVRLGRAGRQQVSVLVSVGYLATLNVKYNTAMDVQACLNGSYINLDNTTMDIYCSVPMLVSGLDITGEGIQYLCSVYVSGGLGSRLSNFTLMSMDSTGDVQYTYRDSAPHPQDVYTIVHPPVNISAVTINAGVFPKMLFLCEVEVYGDSACEEGLYGLDCEYKCDCPCNGTSYLIPGACSHYMTGNISDYDLECAAGTYDPGCEHRCSQYCFKDGRMTTTCDRSTGHCLQGCLDGYMGATCATKCVAGRFGDGCESVCSDNCMPGNKTTGSCHYISGHCFYGCQHGFSGPRCSSLQIEVISPDHSSLALVTGLIVAAVFILPVLYFLRKKRKRSLSEEISSHRMHGNFVSLRRFPRPGQILSKKKSRKS